ncbi:hypothetical protein [Acuticoccus kandeliae]|uniref:hypothetical protein n=1 Tax=Acuticoccus kandeliae TaxID=2073160 RepID=UPI0013001C25|nr:hypothetical protein [Acuticoccus kandeliae]
MTTPTAGGAGALGHDRKHRFINPADERLTFVRFCMPGGLDHVFGEIGRPRTPGARAPEPFGRPGHVEEIEQRTVFGRADGSHTPKN